MMGWVGAREDADAENARLSEVLAEGQRWIGPGLDSGRNVDGMSDLGDVGVIWSPLIGDEQREAEERRTVWVVQMSDSSYGDDGFTSGVYSTAELAMAAHPGCQWVDDGDGGWMTTDPVQGSVSAFTIDP